MRTYSEAAAHVGAVPPKAGIVPMSPPSEAERVPYIIWSSNEPL
jgi:hypothetical protein